MVKLFLRLSFIAFLLSVPFHTHAQTSITGVVTHSFNANAEGKPDAGSKIYALKYDGDAIGLYETVNNFLNAKKLRTLNSAVTRLVAIYKDSADVVKNKRKYEEKYLYYQDIIAKIKADETERLATLQQLGAETNVKFDLLDQQSSKAISKIKLKAFDSKSIADAAGTFSINVVAGKYIVLIISNNRTGLSSTELSGKIFLQLVDTNDGEKTSVSNKFYPD